jgi:hypothetical protein
MPLDLSPVDSISFIGRRSEDGIPGPAALTSQQTYGLYHGSRLTYHAQHVMGLPSEWEREPLLNVGFQAILRMKGDVLVAHLLFNGKPLNGAKVQAFGEDGHENAAAMTNDRGEVAFSAAQIKPGLNGLLIEYLDKDSQGELQGERYIGDAHYLTVTFRR